MNKAADIVERVSVPSVNKAQLQVETGFNYDQVKSPAVDKDIEGGALREGGAPNIYSKQHIGILMQYFGAGLIYSVVYSIIYPFLNNYLRMSGVATSSASVLTALPYTLKVFFGIISDCYPIYGYRRRPYMIIGWIVCGVCCLIMAVLPIGDPYYPDPSLAYVDPTTLPADVVASFNTDAPSNGTKFVLLLIVANLGMVLSFTASGGTVVELSQREPEAIRGTLQAMIWVFRDLGGMIAAALVGFGLNSADFGGSFDGSIGISGLMIICTVVSALTAVSAWYNVTEEKVTARLSVRAEAAKLFDLMQYKVVYYVLAFQLFKNMFGYISVTAAYPIQSVWAKVEPVNSNIASILTYMISAATLTLVTKVGLNWNWRYIVIAAQLGVIIIDVIPTFITIWDVYRSQWFWLGLPLLEQLPTNIGFIVATFCMVEIMEEGNEAAFYGLASSVSSLASPFSTVITKNMDANFDIGLEALQADDHHVRTQVTYAYLCQYGLQIFSLVFVFFLPSQKAETQRMKREGSKSFAVGAFSVVLLLFLLVWAVMTNLMSIFPSTACLVIAGGTGC